MQVATIEHLVVPPPLNGHDGIYREPKELLLIPANTDIEAVLIWLEEHKHSDATFRRYRSVANQLVNWALVEKGKPLSSLNKEDLSEFWDFLSDPNPAGKWISLSAIYGSPEWRPFRKSLSLISKLNTFSVLSSLTAFLVSSGYCDIWRSLRYRTKRNKSPSLKTLARGFQMPKDPISASGWLALAGYLEHSLSADQLETRLAIELMYYCDFNRSMLLELSINDFGIADEWLILTLCRRESQRTIYLAPPITRTIRRLEQYGGLPKGVGIRHDGDVRVFKQSTSVIKNRIIALLRHVATVTADEVIANELLQLPASALTGAWKIHQKDHWLIVWQLIGTSIEINSSLGNYFPARKCLSSKEVVEAYEMLGCT